MSNVLIGIIGVILFIGLALAGALFLGPKFQDATISSKASSWSQGQAQIAAAVNMKETAEGMRVESTTDTNTLISGLVNERYLKSIPVNPAGSQYYYVLRNAAGGLGGPAAFVMNGFFDSDPTAVKLCTEIARRAGLVSGTANTPPSLDAPVGQTGCFRNPNGFGGDGTTLLWAYTRI